MGTTGRDDALLLDLDATSQAALIRKGEIAPAELLEAAIARIGALQPRVNALVDFDPEAARRQAHDGAHDGVFAGVPTLVKDLLAVPGFPTAFGSRLFRGARLPVTSPYAQALRRAGLVVLGKSTTSEFGLLGTTEPLATGPTRNPWRLDLSTGGSSGGAVAAVAAGMVPVAHASDGGGSIRGPASFCGLFGFKPSRGRTVAADVPPDAPAAAFLADHCVSRSVRDSAAWLKATEAPGHAAPLPDVAALQAAPPPRLRIGVYSRDVFGDLPSPDALAALDVATRLCTDLGHDVVETAGPAYDAPAASRAFFTLTAAGLAGMADQAAAMMGPGFDDGLFEPYTRALIRRARATPADEVRAAVATLAAAGASTRAAAAGFDVLLSPTVPFTAFPLGRHGPDRNPDDLVAFTNRLAGYTAPASLAGWPAMSVPLYWSAAGLPLGCHFTAAHDADALLLRLAFQLEGAAGWAPRLRRMQEGLACRND
ncbi:amidase [Massilia sp. PDC64]|nr:amidase family protein [Massilia sp. PDC64]SDF76334.1 amidase [Massilia sp. PDC64]